jgi:cellulose synthase/poly-beta-1,6-N-acetylglucosamine synthase-like glycosyltransferase
MKNIVLIIDFVIVLPFLFFSLYLALLSFLAKLLPGRKLTSDPILYRRFAIVVPAHNEEVVIEKTIRSLMKIRYPVEKFTITVVADNCTDKTASVAKGLGVNVLQRSDTSLVGKGHALKWSFDILLKEQPHYDAFVIVDADTHVSENLLEVMNAYLEFGAECVQCSDIILPQPGAWSSEMTRVGFLLHNLVRPMGRTKVGLCATLNGNGVCLSADLLRRIPWQSFSRVEDLEQSLILALEGVEIHFAPEAEVSSIMPTNPHNAISQRKRWELARFPLIKKYAWSLFRASIKNRSIKVLDTFIELVMPAFANLFAATFAMVFLHCIIVPSGATWLTVPAILWGLSAVLQLFHLLGGLSVAKADRKTYLVLASFPKYVFWKIKVYIRSVLFGDDGIWIRTERENK